MNTYLWIFVYRHKYISTCIQHLFACTNAYMHAYIHIYIHVGSWMCVYMYTHRLTCIHSRMSGYIHTHTYICTWRHDWHRHTKTDTHKLLPAYMYTYVTQGWFLTMFLSYSCSGCHPSTTKLVLCNLLVFIEDTSLF